MILKESFHDFPILDRWIALEIYMRQSEGLNKLKELNKVQ